LAKGMGFWSPINLLCEGSHYARDDQLGKYFLFLEGNYSGNLNNRAHGCFMVNALPNCRRGFIPRLRRGASMGSRRKAAPTANTPNRSIPSSTLDPDRDHDLDLSLPFLIPNS